MPYGLSQYRPLPEGPDTFERGTALWKGVREGMERVDQESANLAAGALAADGDLTAAAQEYYRRGFQAPGSAYAGQQRVKDLDAIAARRRAQEDEDRAKLAPLQDAQRAQALEGIQRSRAVAAATPGINETAVTDPQAAYEQALKLGGPAAAEPYAGVAKAHVQKLYDFSSHLHDTLSRAETPEQWNATLDSAARVPGVKPEMLAEHRIADSATFAAEKTRQIQDLDIQRGVLGAQLGSKGVSDNPRARLTAGVVMPKEMQKAYKEKYGDDLDIGIASSAYKNGQIVVKGEDGKPHQVSPEGTTGYTRTNEGIYGIGASRQAATADVAVRARNQLGSVVDEHAGMLDGITHQPDFNSAMTFLHTPDGLQFWEGRAMPAGATVPSTAIALRMTVKSLEHEYANFVAAGHKGVMSDREGKQLQDIVGQFNKSPTPEAARAAINTLRNLAGAFQTVKMLGPQGAPAQSAPAAAPQAGNTQSLGAGRFHYDASGNLVRENQ